MSLTTVLRTDQGLRALLRRVISRPPWKEPPRLIHPVSRRANLTGTAFDYLLRFALQRRLPGQRVQSGWWIAECARRPPKRRLTAAFLKSAREQHAQYVQGYWDDRSMALTCTVLAKLDFVHRAAWADPEPLTADEEVAEELLDLLGVVPWDRLTPGRAALLNPVLMAGGRVGGADADLLIDGRLIDIKTVQGGALDLDQLRQAVGYALLWRLGGVGLMDTPHSARPVPGDLTHVGVYFARHGALWESPLEDLVSESGWAALTAYLDEHYPARPRP